MSKKITVKKYDVIIIGAGPAGLSAAKILAENGKTVLVLEKNKVIGPKVCAGGLTTKDFKLGINKKIADKFFSKSGDHFHEKSVDEARLSIKRFGEKNVARFDEWCELFL